MWTLLVCICVAATSAVSQRPQSRVVTTNHGPVRGYMDEDGSMFSFYDVPYATVPTGRDKFKAALPPPVWSEPFEAVHRGISCPQVKLYPVKNMQEDCLIANIFVPNTENTNLTVVVNVHGGAFIIGYADLIQMKNFVKNNNIVLVTFNYRIGAYGFLCLGTEGVPGNAGLKDQATLLRWVNQNIARFGGNPNDVTVMGCSAGGGSVDLLTLSNMTNSLFHKAIPESGCSYGGAAVQSDPIQNAKEYAKLLNFTNVDDLRALEEFYMTATSELLSSELVGTMLRPDVGLTFAPCLERDVGVEMFLNEDPADILEKGDFPAIPMLYGLTKEEGMFRLPNFNEWSPMMNRNFSNFLPLELAFDNDEQKEAVAKTVKHFYFGDKEVGPSTILEYIDFHTDVLFGFKMMKAFTLRLAAKEQDIYLYLYSFVDENTPVIPHTDNLRGANHCYQANIISDGNEAGTTEAYRNKRAMMRSLWTNFIFTGKPVPEGSSLPTWPVANITRSPYMDLGIVAQLQNSMFGARFELWDGIYEKHYRKPKRPIPNVPDSVGSVTSNVFIVSFLTICSLASRFY